MVLPLFLLIGLFMFSASTVSAQYVSARDAKVLLEEHISSLPPETHTFVKVNQALTPAFVDQKINELRHMFGRSIKFKLANQKSVSEAIESTYEKASERIPSGMPALVEHLNSVKEEYVNLLTK